MNQDQENTALLVMDMQTAVIQNLSDYTEIVGNLSAAIAIARSRDIPVFFITVKFRPGMPEIGPNNKIFTASKERSANVDMSEIMRIDKNLSPLPGEIVIGKSRISAFTGSDLELIIRAKGIIHLVLAGVATSGVVLSTLTEAADKDFKITVLSDCCTDTDKEVHMMLIDRIFPKQATVASLREWAI